MTNPDSNTTDDNESETGDITVDGRAFNIDHYSRSQSDIIFILSIEVEESTEGTPHHVFKKTIQGVSRSGLTDEYVADVLERWAEKHPEYTIKRFGISEELIARQGDFVGDNDA
jgi:hypothetical protein